MDTQIDYFEILADYDTLSAKQRNELKEVYELINAPDMLWSDTIQKGDASYKGCAALVEALEQIGWTCDYGLDGMPIDLQPMN